MSWSLMEFDIRKEVEQGALLQVLWKIFISSSNQIVDTVDRDALYDSLCFTKEHQSLKTGCSVWHADGDFRTQVKLELLRDYSDVERIKVGVELAKRLDTDVLTGDYTNQCEFLLIDKNGYIYFTLATQHGDKIVDVIKSRETGMQYEDFIQLYPT